MVLPAHQHAAGELCSDGQYEAVGAENPATSRDLQILVYEAAEAISSQRPDGRSGGRGSAAYGRMLGECSVRSVGVVVLEVLLQHRREMARSDDQKWSRHSRRRVAIQRSTMAFALGARTGVRMIWMSAPVNTASKAAVNLLSRSRITNRNWSAWSP